MKEEIFIVSLDRKTPRFPVCGTNFKLTKREYEILEYLNMGYTNIEISKMLFISTNTTKAHISSILKKLKVKNRTQAALYMTMKEMKEIKEMKELKEKGEEKTEH